MESLTSTETGGTAAGPTTGRPARRFAGSTPSNLSRGTPAPQTHMLHTHLISLDSMSAIRKVSAVEFVRNAGCKVQL